jgi:hypothetical protein
MMDAQPSLVRIAVDGLLLDPRAYRAQRDHPDGLRRGLLLVLLIGLAVGLATLIGDLGEYLTQPDPAALNQTLYDGLTSMPWYGPTVSANPEIGPLLDSLFVGPGALSLSPTPQSALIALLVTPIVSVISWFVGGSFVHIAARAFGGTGRFAQTLAAMAVAASANLLGLVQVVPYAQFIPGSLLLAGGILGLILSYIAVRETHGLAPWRAFWAVVVGPLLLTVLLVSLYCCFIFVVVGAAGGLAQGGV